MHLTNPGPGLQDQVWVWLAGEDIKDQESAMDYCRNFLIYIDQAPASLGPGGAA